MPRFLLRRRYFQRFKERLSRLAPGTRRRQWLRLQPTDFIDYWPDIPATLPEKLVFAELARRQINFYFSWYFGDMRITPDYRERYRPDFYLPDYNIIIEVFGTYWHTREGMYEHDLVKAITYTASGYKFIVLTDQEVIHNVREAVESIPEIATAAIHGNMHIIGNRPFDPKAAIRARMQRWPRRDITKHPSQRIESRYQWASGTSTRRPKPVPEPMFTQLTEEQLALARWLEEAYKVLKNWF